MNRFEKAVRKLHKRDREAFWRVARQILSDHTKVPDCKPIKGKKGYYRARFGNYRIIFRVGKGRNPQLLDLKRRNERTYKEL